ncbi:MAG: YceD family protein [Thermoanaerobacteraceae bacterium]
MRIDLSKIKWQVGRSINLDYYEDIKEIEFNGSVYLLEKPIRVYGNITNKKEGLFSDFNISGSLKVVCDRCLDDFIYNINVDVKEYIDIIEEEGNSFENFDLTDFILDNIILSLPMKFICKEDCKGLCPVCGTNLNHNTCNCQRKEIDPRLEILNKLLQ